MGMEKKLCCRKSTLSNSISKDGKRRLLAHILADLPLLARASRPPTWDAGGEPGQDRDSWCCFL